jgi:hypothetical protein
LESRGVVEPREVGHAGPLKHQKRVINYKKKSESYNLCD